MEPPSLVVPGRIVGGRDLRTRDRRDLHLPRQLVRAGVANVVGGGRFVGAKGSLTWDGADTIRIEALASGERQGLFDPVKPVEPPALSPEDRIGGHFGVLHDFVAAVRSGTQPETAGRDNIRSLAMVFGAIESAEVGRRVSIVV
jgi:predicted dehydrogenase